MSKDKTANRLINEKSPYLIQHAYNPVNWYPWGEEAFEKARKENKPIMVSIGYSTCHWCHVMEKESFEDEEVAELLNERFVSIKVDREERPDIDTIYMKVVQGLTGQGGWPLHVFLTPDQKPFYGGVYFPKVSRYGRPGFIDVITHLYDEYKDNRDKMEEIGEKITRSLKEREKTSAGELDETILHKTFNQLSQSFDSVYGGIGQAPKFPTPHILTFLFQYFYWTGNELALTMATRTLDAMANGGIYDHIGYGFSRYSVDQEWLVPHFEKMLYDNALLLIAYTEGYQLTKNERYRIIANQIIAYITRDMTDSEGAFYSAEDADSEGVEGKFYVWSKHEIIAHLGEKLGELFCKVFDISDEGNFEGENIPNLIHSRIDDISMDYGFTKSKLIMELDKARSILFEKREKRVHPHKDDKILTAWNAYMVAALAISSRTFQNKTYLDYAEKAIHFIEKKLIQDGRIMVRYRDGEVAYKGNLDDYANLVWAYIELYETSFNSQYLIKAKKVTDEMIELYWDKVEGGFYFYGDDSESLIMRPKELYDGATPSGNSVAAKTLWRLGELTGETKYTDLLQKMFTAFSQTVKEYPSGYVHFLDAYMLAIMGGNELVILEKENEQTGQINSVIQQDYHPNLVVLRSNNLELLKEIAPFTKYFQHMNDKTTYYLCENYSCLQPTNNVELIIKEINK